MQNSYKDVKKGGNICSKFTSMQYARNAIYNAVSSELSPLEQQQQKMAGAFEYTVAGIAKALEDTNTGWQVDAAFKQEEEIKPVTVLPQINQEIVGANVETWTSNMPIQEQCLVEQDPLSQEAKYIHVDKNDGIWVVNSETILSSGDNENVNCSLRYFINENDIFTLKKELTLDISNSHLSRINVSNEYELEACFCRAIQYENTIQFIIIGKMFNLNITNNASTVTSNYFKWIVVYDYRSNLFTRDEIKILEDTISDTTFRFQSNTVMFAPYSDNSFVAYGRKNSTSDWYFFSFDAAANIFFKWNDAIAGDVNCITTDDVNRVYTAIDHHQGGWTIRSGFLTSGSYNSQSIGDVQKEHYDTREAHFILLSQDKNYCIFCYQFDDLNYLYIKNLSDNTWYTVEIGTFTPTTYVATDNYLYFNQSEKIMCRFTLPTQFLSGYGIPINFIPTCACYDKKLYIGGALQSGEETPGIYCALIDNYTTQTTTIDSEPYTPLVTFCNLTHSSGSQLQLSCIYRSKKQLLFDNTGSYLYGNDIGFSYLSKNSAKRFDSSNIDQQEPSWHICVYDENNYLSGLLKEEVIANQQLGQIDYHIVASKDGKFVGLMLKDNHGVIANIGCGDLISELQYPEYDTAKNAHTMYYSLGFIDSSLSTVPRSNNPTNSLVLAFVAPTYQGFRFYGGQNQDLDKDLQYFAQGASYQYINIQNSTGDQVLGIDDLIYTMPIVIGISSDNPVVQFNTKSGLKGQINRAYLVRIKLNQQSVTNGYILDNGNYLYLGNNWALGWDSSNQENVNPYGGQ